MSAASHPAMGQQPLGGWVGEEPASSSQQQQPSAAPGVRGHQHLGCLLG